MGGGCSTTHNTSYEVEVRSTRTKKGGGPPHTKDPVSPHAGAFDTCCYACDVLDGLGVLQIRPSREAAAAAAAAVKAETGPPPVMADKASKLNFRDLMSGAKPAPAQSGRTSLTSTNPTAKAVVDARAAAAAPRMPNKAGAGVLALTLVRSAFSAGLLERPPVTTKLGGSPPQLPIFGKAGTHDPVEHGLFGEPGESWHLEQLAKVQRDLASALVWLEERSDADMKLAGFTLGGGTQANVVALEDAADQRLTTKRMVARCIPGLHKAAAHTGDDKASWEASSGGGDSRVPHLQLGRMGTAAGPNSRAVDSEAADEDGAAPAVAGVADREADDGQPGHEAAWLPAFLVAASFDMSMLALLAQMDPAVPSESPVLRHQDEAATGRTRGGRSGDRDESGSSGDEDEAAAEAASGRRSAARRAGEKRKGFISSSAWALAERNNCSGWQAELVVTAQRYSWHMAKCAEIVRCAFEGRTARALRRRAMMRLRMKAVSETGEHATSALPGTDSSINLETLKQTGWEVVVRDDIRAVDLFVQCCKRAVRALTKIRLRFDMGKVEMSPNVVELFSDVLPRPKPDKRIANTAAVLMMMRANAIPPPTPVLSPTFCITNKTLASVTLSATIQAWSRPQAPAGEKSAKEGALKSIGAVIAQSKAEVAAAKAASPKATPKRGRAAGRVAPDGHRRAQSGSPKKAARGGRTSSANRPKRRIRRSMSAPGAALQSGGAYGDGGRRALGGDDFEQLSKSKDMAAVLKSEMTPEAATAAPTPDTALTAAVEAANRGGRRVRRRSSAGAGGAAAAAAAAAGTSTGGGTAASRPGRARDRAPTPFEANRAAKWNQRSRDISETITLHMRHSHDQHEWRDNLDRTGSSAAAAAAVATNGPGAGAGTATPGPPQDDHDIHYNGSDTFPPTFSLRPGESIFGVVEVVYPEEKEVNGKVLHAGTRIKAGVPLGGNLIFKRRGRDADLVIPSGDGSLASRSVGVIRFSGKYGEAASLFAKGATTTSARKPKATAVEKRRLKATDSKRKLAAMSLDAAPVLAGPVVDPDVEVGDDGTALPPPPMQARATGSVYAMAL